MSAASGPGPAPSPAAAYGREHALVPPRTRRDALARRLQTALERAVARVSRLPDHPVYEPADFPWTAEVERHWPAIRRELDQVMRRREALPDFHGILEEVRTITADTHWKTFWLVGAGFDCRENARRCPDTMRALRAIPHVLNAFFSILAPGKRIPAHRGAYSGILRYHLGVTVPEPAERCGIRVGDRICHWREGGSLVFDDSFNHEAWNDTDGWRVVLFVDFARPLKPPWDWMNRALLWSARLVPFMRRAGQRHRAWQRGFYGAQEAATR